MGESTLARQSHTLRISLRGSFPEVWRVIQVPSDMTLQDLSKTLEWFMGWEHDSHLHLFDVSRTKDVYAQMGYEWSSGEYKDESEYQIKEILYRSRMKLIWEYDLGDSWIHDIVVQSIGHAGPEVRIPRCIDGANACPPEDSGGITGYDMKQAALRGHAGPEVRIPRCIDGANACPPEDSGGITGYDMKQAALRDKSDPYHKAAVEWLGDDFDPTHFDLAKFDIFDDQ